MYLLSLGRFLPFEESTILKVKNNSFFHQQQVKPIKFVWQVLTFVPLKLTPIFQHPLPLTIMTKRSRAPLMQEVQDQWNRLTDNIAPILKVTEWFFFKSGKTNNYFYDRYYSRSISNCLQMDNRERERTYWWNPWDEEKEGREKRERGGSWEETEIERDTESGEERERWR